MAFHLSFVRDVIFGWNSINELKRAIEALKGNKVLIITGKRVGKEVVSAFIEPALEGVNLEVWDDVTPEPGAEVADAARNHVRGGRFDVVVGIGGGSVLDVAKIAAALASTDEPVNSYIGSELPEREVGLILCPTTAGTGSEVTNLAVLELENPRIKHVFEGKSLYADVAIVDPALTLSAPPSVTVSSGIDALCHAIEAFVSLRSNPFTDALAKEAISSISIALREVYSNGKNVEAREKMSLAALLAGIAFNCAGTNLGHAFGYAHSHLHGCSHGVAVAVTMPYVMQYNAMSRIEKHAAIAELMGERVEGLNRVDAAMKAGVAFLRLLEDLNLPARLSDLGIEEDSIPEIVDRIFLSERHVCRNPREVRRDELERLVKDAITGNLAL